MMLILPRWLGLLVVWLLAFFDPGTWAVWHFRATIVNNGVNSGNHEYNITPGAGNICILIGGEVLQGDSSSTRAVDILLRNDDDDRIRLVLSAIIGTSTRRDFPTSESSADANFASVGAPFIISGTEDLNVLLSSLAINQDSELSLQMLVFGGPPTVVLTSPTDAVETETENRIV